MPFAQSRLLRRFIHIFALFLLICAARAERINHEGRILGPMPSVTNVILFDTPEADAIMSGLQIFPRDNAWNEDISRRPLLTNSDAMMGQIFSDLASNRRTAQAFQEMNFVLVPTNQPLVPIQFDTYADESDPSPYPFPANTPIEGWPTQTGSQTLFDWQTDINGVGGDRHAIVIQPSSGLAWETWSTDLVVANNATNWTAANGAKWNLNTNALRPAGWTSADAAGLPMLGGLVRYDECERGMVEHAMRLIVKRTRRAYIYPATHAASTTNLVDLPAMGQRLRLKSSFAIPSTWTKEEKAILKGLQKYGAIVADNGGFFSISVVPDNRWPSGAFSHFSSLSVTNFEVVQSTGPTEGPRSPGAPQASAGADIATRVGVAVSLQGTVVYTNPAPLTTTWSVYSGPGQVTFSNPTLANTTATFSAPGTYTLMLKADNGIHTPAFDAVMVTVSDAIQLRMRRTGTNAMLEWQGGTPPYTVEKATTLSAAQWQPLLTTNGTNLALGSFAGSAFFRVKGQ
jgi:hypothetical protein